MRNVRLYAARRPYNEKNDSRQYADALKPYFAIRFTRVLAHSAQAERMVEFAGARFRPGAWLYADSDGIVVAEASIHR